MTRKEGIAMAYITTTTENKGPAERRYEIFDVEYNNYTELCEFCGEQPKDKNTWLNETITPANK